MAVSIWEGNKAQALIESVDKIANSGLIGSNAKRALLACFRNVAWTTDQGEALYNDLYNALYSGGSEDPDALYNSAWPITLMGGYQSIDNKIFETSNSYTFLCDVTEQGIDYTVSERIENGVVDFPVIIADGIGTPFRYVVLKTANGVNVANVVRFFGYQETFQMAKEGCGNCRYKVALSFNTSDSIPTIKCSKDLVELQRFDATGTMEFAHNTKQMVIGSVVSNGSVANKIKINSLIVYDYAMTSEQMTEWITSE